MQDRNAQDSTSTTQNMVNGIAGVGSLSGVVEQEEAEIEDDEDPKSTSSEPAPASGGFFASLFKL